MRRSVPLNQAVEQSVHAEHIRDLVKPETIVWAKLRGYPWWPGRVKGPENSPKELVQIAKTHHRPGSVVTVYFFGSHDFSLVPVESLRPFEANWELFSKRSSSSRFNQALIEARNPEKCRNFEIAPSNPKVDLPANNSNSNPSSRGRKRGRPSKSWPAYKPSKHQDRVGRDPRHLDFRKDTFSKEHLMYCRTKLQKILLRTILKEAEIPISVEILVALSKSPTTLEAIRDTKIGVVLEKASRRPEFSTKGKYFSIDGHIRKVFRHWRPLLARFMKEVGMAL